ncbi:hypothetical protein F0L17_10950 [Streptomyces sp. TRM43335]|uniref:CBM6 domain-containing protein n=1 Tax=Streptomyces taklimakanensis TaxID=2569853 RepID=A0A6G2BBJ3_9ACTN|nr:hypothetical protein [Streptomyces taklimakanensis]MTE19637.1 hypothetical protein [Streptomyces taklimakanensis]
MTAGNNGSGTPENDDPFAYLYRSEDGTDGGAGDAATQQPGVPRTSYHQVRAVGQRRYGGVQQGRQPQQPPPPQAAHQQPNAYYAAPETVPGGRAAARREAAAGPGGPGGRGRGGRSHNGLLIGAIAVVVAVILGVGAAVVFSDDDTGGNQAGTAPSPTAEESGGDTGEDEGETEGSDSSDKAPAPLPEEEAVSLRLEGGASVPATAEIKGSRARNGSYVTGLDNPGAGVSWSFEVPEAGKYTLFVGYGVPGKDANSTLTVNGEPRQDPLNMKNFAKAGEGEWEKGWTRTYAWVDLEKGTNSVKISCEQGNQCGFVLDQVWLEKGHVSSSG